jgi:hypothetical protein
LAGEGGLYLRRGQKNNNKRKREKMNALKAIDKNLTALNELISSDFNGADSLDILTIFKQLRRNLDELDTIVMVKYLSKNKGENK